MVDPGKRRRLKAERPAAILEAALDAFSANGFAATRLEDVAARVGITKGTIYIYFPSKEDLFVATLKEKMRPVLEHLADLTAEGEGSTLDILRRHFTFVARQLVEDRCGRDILRILLAEGHRFPAVMDRWFAEVMVPAMEIVSQILRRGVERGEFRASPVIDYPMLAMAPIFLCHNWQLMVGDRAPLDVPAFLEAALDLLARGLLR